MKKWTWLAIGLLVGLCGCNMPEFESAAYIDSQRFLGVRIEPLEAAPGEQVTITALVTRKDGLPYDGPMAWMVTGGNAAKAESDGAFDPALSAVTSPGQPFVWTVPEREELEENFGPFGENGLLLTVIAAAFKNGDMADEARLAYKMFVVSEREPETRLTNPALTELVVRQAGKEIAPNELGQYPVADGKIEVQAFTDQANNDDLSFHWFSLDKDLQPEFSDTQTLKTNGHELLPVYCVLRQELFFEGDDGGRILLTGADWIYARIVTK